MRLAPSLLIVLVLAACVREENDPEPAAALAVLSAEERRVHAAVFDAMAADTARIVRAFPALLGTLTDARLVEIKAEDPVPDALVRTLPAFSEQTWADFVQRSGEPAEVTEALPGTVGLIDEGAVRSLFSAGVDEGWQAFRVRYPEASGLAVVSRVGFSPDADEALVFVSVSCGGHCGYGQYMLLRRKVGSWNVVGTSVAWVA